MRIITRCVLGGVALAESGQDVSEFRMLSLGRETARLTSGSKAFECACAVGEGLKAGPRCQSMPPSREWR